MAKYLLNATHPCGARVREALDGKKVKLIPYSIDKDTYGIKAMRHGKVIIDLGYVRNTVSFNDHRWSKRDTRECFFTAYGEVEFFVKR